MTPPTGLRAEVLDLRTRLERVAVAAFDEVCRPECVRQSEIRERLVFVVGLVGVDERHRVRRLARLGAHVYRRSSDVLHGRVSSLGISDDVVEEWRAVVEALEQVIASGPSAHQGSPRLAVPRNRPPRRDGT